MKSFPGARKRWMWRVVATAAAALALPLAALAAPSSGAVVQAAGTTARTTADTASCPWLNQSLPIQQRVSLLMAQMTLADKINMVTGAGTSEPYVFYISAIPSLCVPAIGEEDGPLGVGDGLTGVTQMPSAASVAASFDTSLAYQYGQVVGSEERAKGAMVDLGPTVNIDRDPRWGRSFEAYTEDPYLNSALAVADVDGVQSTGEMAQIKHFAVYNQETNRNAPADDAIVSTRAEQEIYLPAFYAGTTQAHASSVMCAYSYINGQAACQNQYLLQTTLDQNWGYPGFVTSDYGATHSTVQSADAGNDQEMPVGAVLRPGAAVGGAGRPGLDGHPQRHGQPHPDRDVQVQRVQQPADRVDQRDRHHPRPPGGLHLGRRGGHGAAEELRRHPAAGGERGRHRGGDRPGRLGRADRHRRRQRPRDLHLQRDPAAGHPGRGRDGHHGATTCRACPPTRPCRRSRAPT